MSLHGQAIPSATVASPSAIAADCDHSGSLESALSRCWRATPNRLSDWGISEVRVSLRSATSGSKQVPARRADDLGFALVGIGRGGLRELRSSLVVEGLPRTPLTPELLT